MTFIADRSKAVLNISLKTMFVLVSVSIQCFLSICINVVSMSLVLCCSDGCLWCMLCFLYERFAFNHNINIEFDRLIILELFCHAVVRVSVCLKRGVSCMIHKA